ncbi:MAG: peptidoglycan bridge formation glycyltransferase FemA/FemB family protein [Deltaproteobacteria bacterium]|nr:peptidoglycan bridge formation glycyltransferase FemA/FemB family protein [Deltaproteobacteria bacterium]
MFVSVSTKPTRDLLPTGILFQSAWWSAVKRRLGLLPLAADYRSRGANGDLLAITRPIADGIAMAHVPYGPEWGPDAEHRGPFLEALSESLRPYLPPSVAFLRFDLPWESAYAGDPRWQAPDGLHHPEPWVAEMRMNWGTRSRALRKAPSDALAADTIILDLTDDDDRLLAAMKPKTRYNIRLAARHDIHVEIAGADRLPEFYALYRATARRNGFAAHGLPHFAAMFSTPRTTLDELALVLLLASYRREVIAAAILSLCRDRATYLFGASSDHHRERMAPYGIQWGAIQLARARGCATYDLYGIAPTHHVHPLAGVRRFKAGFGGRLTHRAGSWDFPLDPVVYERFRAHELVL